MLKVYICEDDRIQSNKLENLIANIILIENYDMEIALATEKPQQILENIIDTESTGVYFLDVDLKDEINGIVLGEKIRKYDPNGFIIFITTHDELSYLTFQYKVEALDYIIKDNYKLISDRVSSCLRDINNRYLKKSNNNELFSINSNDKLINIEYDKILFFETSANAHKLILYGIDRRIEFYGALKDVEDELKEKDFIRCHKAFLVNNSNIKEIDKKKRIAYMIDGSSCLISVRGMKLLQRKI